jgi:hypothetical protein
MAAEVGGWGSAADTEAEDIGAGRDKAEKRQNLLDEVPIYRFSNDSGAAGAPPSRAEL